MIRVAFWWVFVETVKAFETERTVKVMGKRLGKRRPSIRKLKAPDKL